MCVDHGLVFFAYLLPLIAYSYSFPYCMILCEHQGYWLSVSCSRGTVSPGEFVQLTEQRECFAGG